jgi:hypothetical protein
VNVEFLGFHEGRGAGKTDPRGGRDLVNRKKIVTRKEKDFGSAAPTVFHLIGSVCKSKPKLVRHGCT